MSAFAVIFLAMPAAADWDPAHKIYWPHLPDLSPTGMGVDNYYVPLADDFRCLGSGPITGIHVWNSFAGDVLPDGGADSLSFLLSLHADIPAGQQGAHSMPGAVLWSQQFDPGEYSVCLVVDNIVQDWYDPATGTYLPADHQQCYRYDFDVTDEPFEQEVGTIYWLEVKVVPDYAIGWKTTKARLPDLCWNDDAVWLSPAGWQPLAYPAGHPYAGEGLDLAFVVTPEPGSMALIVVGAVAVLTRRRI